MSNTCAREPREVIGDQGIANVCSVLGCASSAVAEAEPIEEGLTNSSYKVVVDGSPYVYRVPGVGTEKIIDRRSETFSQGVARELGIDDTFVFEDEKSGWKLSRFIDGCLPFDYHNPEHVVGAMGIARKLHGCGVQSKWSFDLGEKTAELDGLLNEAGYELPADYQALSSMASELVACAKGDGVPQVLCHNDFYEPNFLVKCDQDSLKLYLIDWEYSAMADYASDLGTFICCSDYTVDEALSAISQYFGRTPTKAEKAHCLAYVSLAAWYWYVWALYKDCTGDPVGDWQELWHGYASEYGSLALEAYESKDNLA